VLYCAEERIHIGTTEYRAYVYLDEKRQAEEKEHFLKEIMECERFVRLEGFTGKKEINAFFRDTKPALSAFFGLRKNGNVFELLRDTAEINAKLSRMGMFVLITNTDLSGEEGKRSTNYPPINKRASSNRRQKSSREEGTPIHRSLPL
jgi:hypothetical protein